MTVIPCQYVSQNAKNPPSKKNKYPRNVALVQLKVKKLLLERRVHSSECGVSAKHLGRFIFCYSMAFAYHYISEFCKARWLKTNDEMSWAPKNDNSTNEYIRD